MNFSNAICPPFRSRTGSRCFALTLLLELVFATAAPAAGLSATNDPGLADLRPALQNRLAEAKAEFNRFGPAAGQTTNPPGGAMGAEVTEYRLLTESLVLAYEQHLDELARLAAAHKRHQELEQTTRTGRDFTEPTPYSILLDDNLRDSIQSLTAKIAASETSRQVLLQFAAESRSTLEVSDGQLRRLAEQLETATDPGQIARLNWQKTMEQTRNRLAMANMGLNQTRQQVLQVSLADDRQRLALLRRRLALVAQHTRFSRADLDQVIDKLDAERRGLETELPAAETENERRQRALAAAREELRKLLEIPADAVANPAEREGKVQRLQLLIGVCTVQAETSAQQLIGLRQLREIVNGQRGLWQMRFDMFATHDTLKRQQGYKRLSHLAALVQVAKPHFVQQTELAARQIAEQQNRLRQQAGSPSDLIQAQDLLDSYRQQEVLALRTLREISQLERLTQRWRESLDQERQSLPFFGRLRELFTGLSGFASNLWNFELFAAQDTITVDGQPITGRRSVTVGKILMAVLILMLGYGLAVLLSRLLERLAARRLNVEPNQANLIRRWTCATLVIGLVIFSMISVKIPLTVFAFLGGALAIGLGFGTQNLLKNFISGIIILFERPFRVGDVLDIEGRRGVVTSIGLRSSVLRLWDGTETLIPNSALLENNLTNWTYSGQVVRFSISVGAVYGSDTGRVAQALTEVADRHGLVQKEPKPLVLFQEFGDSELLFELRYWVNVRQHNAAQIGSDLRHMITTVFAERGIKMAYPQRDIHLDSASPLLVQVMAPEKPRLGVDGHLDGPESRNHQNA